MFKLKTDLLPTNIGSYFDVSCNNTTHSYNLRKRGTLTTGPIVEPRLSSGKKSIQYRGEIIWDKISDDIKDSRSVFHLKEKLRKICWNKKKRKIGLIYVDVSVFSQVLLYGDMFGKNF